MAVGQIVSGVFLSVLTVVSASLLAESGYNNYKYGQFTVSVSEDTKHEYFVLYKSVENFLRYGLHDATKLIDNEGEFNEAFDKLVHRTTVLLMKTIDNLKDPALLNALDDSTLSNLIKLASNVEFVNYSDERTHGNTEAFEADDSFYDGRSLSWGSGHSRKIYLDTVISGSRDADIIHGLDVSMALVDP